MTNPSQQINGQRTSFSYTFNNDALPVHKNQQHGINVQYSKKRTVGGGTIQTIGAFSFDNPVHISSFDPPGSTPFVGVAEQTPVVTPKPKVVGFKPIKSALRSSLRPQLKSPVPAVTSPSPSNPAATMLGKIPRSYDRLLKEDWLDKANKEGDSAATQLLNQNRALTSMTEAVWYIVERYGKNASDDHIPLKSSDVCCLAEYLTDECARSAPKKDSEVFEKAATIVREMDTRAAELSMERRFDQEYVERFDAKEMWQRIGASYKCDDPAVTTFIVEVEGKNLSLAECINGREGEDGVRSVRIAKYMETVHEIIASRVMQEKEPAKSELVVDMAIAMLEAQGDAAKIAEIRGWPDR